MQRCPLCHGGDLRLLYPSNLQRRRRRTGRYACTSAALGVHPDIFRCASCSFVCNEPSAGQLDHLEEYARVDDPDYLEQRASRRLTYDRELDALERLCEGRDLLDVGCYSGFFLEQARDRGWRVQGVEPSKWAAEHARRTLGLPVFHGPIERFEPEDERRFDVVTFWDVVEHLSDPVDVLTHARGFLREGGLLAFTTHNLDSWAARLLRGRYPLFMEMHTVHLNDRTLGLLLEKSGFELVERRPHRRALRLEYLATRLRRVGELPARAGVGLVRQLGLSDRIVWIGFLGLETVVARARTVAP
jgi:SAM-dependent methyltransferase